MRSTAAILVLALLAPTGDLRAAPPPEREPAKEARPAEEAPKPPPVTRKRGRRGRIDHAERPAPARRKAEASPAPTPEQVIAREATHTILLHEARGCAIRKEPKLVQRLLSLRHVDQVLSLELWGDLRAYANNQKVLFFARTPLSMYLTLFWIGPKGDIFVPFANVRIPAHQNTMIDPDAIIVPPLGHERWVAYATLEPVAFTCAATEANHIATVDKAVSLPHAIGRWEVWSK